MACSKVAPRRRRRAEAQSPSDDHARGDDRPSRRFGPPPRRIASRLGELAQLGEAPGQPARGDDRRWADAARPALARSDSPCSESRALRSSRPPVVVARRVVDAAECARSRWPGRPTSPLADRQGSARCRQLDGVVVSRLGSESIARVAASDPAEPCVDRRVAAASASASRSMLDDPRATRRAPRARCAGRGGGRWPAPASCATLGEVPERVERLLEVGHRLPVGRARRRPWRRPGGDRRPPCSHTSPRSAWWASRSTCSASRSG